jgi:hypothetical protein
VIGAVNQSGDAKYHRYGCQANPQHVIHVVGPDFRTKNFTRCEATEQLTKAYTNVLTEFIDAALPMLRLLPIQGLLAGLSTK